MRGTRPETKMTTSGVNSPQTSQTRMNSGSLCTSFFARRINWKSARESVPAYTAARI